MDHTPRTTLPHPGPHHISARDQYSHSTPSFRRQSEHSARSPSFPGSHYRRHPISPTPTLTGGYGAPNGRMDAQFANRAPQNNIPPLEDIKVLGVLTYQDHNKTNIEIGINGIIDKGFFLADKEWTCYRRNYFSTVTSFSLTPYIPNVATELKLTGSRSAMTVVGFAMSLSAVVSDNDQHTIELIQHTPKRDKGPVNAPRTVPMMAKQDSNHHHVNFYSGPSSMNQSIYPDGWVPAEAGGNGPQTEYTFERIQFKQATQNNGKRRAAQQYYHLVIDLYANTGSIERPQWVRVAFRKSAKMIVRGRSPGHYQGDRRNSSNGPSGSAGPSGTGFGAMGVVRDFSAPLGMNPYTTYGNQGDMYGQRHHALPPEAMIPPADEKAIETEKSYQYYPGAMYQDQTNGRLDAWNHATDDQMVPHVVAGVDINGGRVKAEYENNTLPRLVQPASLTSNDQGRNCRPFEGKPTSNGFFPHPTMSPSSSINMPLQ